MLFRRGEMVTSGGPPMRFVEIAADGIAKCLFIDNDGIVQDRFIYFSHLKPMRDALQPRSRWPESGHLDLVEIEREEVAAAEVARLRRRMARRSKPSRKIKRTVVPA